nr:DEAD/DEAH box helicase [uncultured Anaerosporobacter sp.]
MNENEVHFLVENVIQNKNIDLLTASYNFDNARDEYVYSTAIRFVKIWLSYQNNEIKKVDFECALRNYLLILKREIIIPNYVPSNRFEEFGLQINTQNGKVWTSLLLPEFTNNVLVKQLYMQDITIDKEDMIHNLYTNSFIRNLTPFQFFKSNEQKLAVMGALRVPNGYSCLVSMTTGGGKSLITQTVAYQKEGLTIVIVPTISLMLDQYKNARAILNSDVEKEIFFYHSDVSLGKFYDSLKKKKAKILFVSPESLIKNKGLKDAIQKANEEKYLKNIIIDEAHIIIEWGSLFRIDFQCLDTLRRNLLRENDTLRTYLLSATYSDETIRQLKLFYADNEKWIEVRCEKLRHETRFDIIKCDNYGEKKNKILKAIDLLPRPMIVYVKSPDDAEKLKETLCERGYNNIYTFTGNTGNDQRLNIIEKWKSGEFDLMIATCAFGVGVDKKDVRTVLHTYVPENPNKYYQEAGRGGRDGLPCLSAMIYTEQDVDSAFSFVSKVITTEKLVGRWFSMMKSNRTQSLHDSKYLIDTYVKPDYNADEEFIDSISNQDVNWNVYVILFLRRNGLVTIDDIQYINNKYVFYITVIKRKILSNDDETVSMIDDIRNKEWEKTEHDFLLMKKNLNKVGKCCWSDMFTKIYRKTHDYCAGCNEHTDITNFEDSHALKTEIAAPLSKVKEDIVSYVYGAKCMLSIDNEYEKDILNVINMGLDVFVSDDSILKLILEKKDKNNSLLYCNYSDFLELVSSNKYYISGAVGICFPDNISMQNRIVNIIENNIKGNDICFLLFANKDYYISNKSKKLSELPFVQYCRQ